MYKVGEYNLLRVKKESEYGLFLDGGDQEILMPKRFVPAGAQKGDELKVFIYHDSENRLTATNQEPYGIVGDIVNLKATGVTEQGAFLDWGLMKDLFVPASKQLSKMHPGQDYLVKIYLDELTNRVAATEKIDPYLSNENLTVKELDMVDMIVYRRSEIGFIVIINNQHTGVLHYSEVFGTLDIGDKLKGFIKSIKREKIDVVVGKPGYDRVESEADKILRLLKENDGYLPYHDKSDPEEIYEFFSMSKKTFKMTTGALYKQHKIIFTQTGIKLIDEE
ncbi:CvfB family protein [Chitinophaga pinensis]|uniref:RNA binding S1 domain protein n=1 Tax=Chitinophaga pinensis (strain ATCC 43595 / DSM 2588 / LMG 13176 / NBRC 15968 / NCIMB 11800 / UQM 2034) TaxID=485918 RepID=A0A979G3G0_CHIPD|nr:S1-like domain-containing RNA-binding protein [Chitinophaga pinensis]ACU60062.1 RNA binding S1 domain protein [Chitinophaga pinensis DSM 2588]